MEPRSDLPLPQLVCF